MILTNRTKKVRENVLSFVTHDQTRHVLELDVTQRDDGILANVFLAQLQHLGLLHILGFVKALSRTEGRSGNDKQCKHKTRIGYSVSKITTLHI